MIVKLKERRSLNDDVRNPLRLAQMGAQWLFGKRGPLTVGAGQVGGLVATEHAQGGRADVLFNVMPLSVDKPGDPLHRFSGFSASAAQCRPESTGTRRARERRPAGAAAHPRRLPDRSARRQGAGRRPAHAARDLRAAGVPRPRHRRGVPAGQRRRPARPRSRPSRAPRAAPCSTRPAPAAWAATHGSVVDARLRVRGVDGLRVIDASVMPRVVSTNTNAAAIMIGEKGAALVLEDAAGAAATGARQAARRPRRHDPRQRRGAALRPARRPVPPAHRQGRVEGGRQAAVARAAGRRVRGRPRHRAPGDRPARRATAWSRRSAAAAPSSPARRATTAGCASRRRCSNLADVYRDTQPTILNIDESSARSPLPDRGRRRRGRAYVYMRRVHAHQGRPYCVIDIYLDAEIFARAPGALPQGDRDPAADWRCRR